MKLSTEKISSRVLYVVIAMTAVVVAAFFGIGYDTMSEENASLNDPLCTNLLLWFMYLLTLLTVGVTIASIVWSIKRGNKIKDESGVPTRKIIIGVISLLVLSLVVTFITGDASPMKTGEGVYNDAFWLKITDMFINTSAVLMVVAIGAAMVGMRTLMRKK
jgi:hypothetical protein